MKQFRHFLLLALLASTIISCKKDEDPAPATKADMLAAHNWRIEAITVSPPIAFENEDGSTTVVSNLYSQFFGVCVQDDIYSFKKNNQYTVEDAGTSCGGDKIRFAGSWIISSDETAIFLTGGGLTTYLTGDSENWTITELTDSTLKATLIISGETTDYTVTYTFSAIQ